ncbi:MAG: helix-turn-helix transcriptional regulator [Clostridia bacterium]|nr:helix-turn-helix transcriptional regulator [Clostridia bacterium]
MDVCEAVKTRIYSLCAQRGISINKLATEAGLSRSSLKNILYGKSRNPGIVTIKILCDGLNMSLAQFFDAEPFSALDQEIK